MHRARLSGTKFVCMHINTHYRYLTNWDAQDAWLNQCHVIDLFVHDPLSSSGYPTIIVTLVARWLQVLIHVLL